MVLETKNGMYFQNKMYSESECDAILRGVRLGHHASRIELLYFGQFGKKIMSISMLRCVYENTSHR